MPRASIHSRSRLTVSLLPAPSTPPTMTMTDNGDDASSFCAFKSSVRRKGTWRLYVSLSMPWPPSPVSNMRTYLAYRIRHPRQQCLKARQAAAGIEIRIMLDSVFVLEAMLDGILQAGHYFLE